VRNIGWTPKSLRSFKRLVRKNPSLRPLIEQTLQQLAIDPFYTSLRTHKLKGDLSEVWACSVDSDLQILFEFVKQANDEDAILLLNVGSHDEVY
jgi:addiction module RelE/StbE family toxin